MKTGGAKAAFLGAILACPAAWRQDGGPTAVEMADEPHHTLILKNQAVRVFRLSLQPKEVTLPHRHGTFYAFVSLRPVTVSNEVRGRQPVLTELKAGELHTSKGGFTIAERNVSSEAAQVLVIEPMKRDDGKSFSTPMGSFRLHDAAIGELFESSVVRAYIMTIAVGGRVEKHREDYGRLLVALSDLTLREEGDGQPVSEMEIRSGEVRWVEPGAPHSTTNVGTSPADFLTLEFR